VLENCERQYSIEDCLALSARINIPVVFDTHHHECYAALHPEERLCLGDAYIPAVLDTWKRRGIKPKFHVSEQGCGKVGHHSDLVEVLPQYLLDIPALYGVDIDIMIEAKAKEQAIAHLFAKYPLELEVPDGLLIPAPVVPEKKRKRAAAP
jgi:UV DNA damage endonuclease